MEYGVRGAVVFPKKYRYPKKLQLEFCRKSVLFTGHYRWELIFNFGKTVCAWIQCLSSKIVTRSMRQILCPRGQRVPKVKGLYGSGWCYGIPKVVNIPRAYIFERS